MEWVQVYNPLGTVALSTIAAALPIVVLLMALGVLEWRAHWAAFTGLATAVLVAGGVFGTPWDAAAAATLYGAAYGFLPIGWIVLNAVFLYNLTVRTGTFEVVKSSVATLSGDRRIQTLLVAFSFGAFLEGAAGFGTPVAITAALMAGLGFAPFYAAGMALIANTAPVAFGAIGTPILTLGAITGISTRALSAMAARQLPLVSVLIPAWLIVTMSGWRGLNGVWPAVLVSGGSFAVVQFLWGNFVGPELVDITAGLISLISLAVFCTYWHPAETWDFGGDARQGSAASPAAGPRHARGTVFRAWMPWVILSLFVMVWGVTPAKVLLNSGPAGVRSYWATGKVPAPSPVLSPVFDVPALHRRVFRDYPVRPQPVDRDRLADPAYKAAYAEPASFTINWLSATGTGILFAALVTAMYLRIRPRVVLEIARATLKTMAWPLVTITMTLALGFVTRYGGSDATLGLAFTRTGWLYPFFAAMLGWFGVALTGSDTSSNVLFGSLQKITAQQLGLSPVLMAAANSTGGVMGKMISPQSIVVATAATGQQGQEGKLLRFVFWHSVVLAALMGLIVMAQAYVFPWMIPAS